ncbi:putative E3 ubiquitin-protein ligase RING1a [Tasmannia lanceolata]|uniref:putative E3 ubiquitin-protein ligase RING1a n=1 Tax=Tasmannia lanceolata TaxID=3420 RepID=UPI00406327D3
MPVQKRFSGNLEDDEVSPPVIQRQQQKQEPDDSDEDPSSCEDKDEFVLVKLSDIRKEVQCPICLGIIRKTRTVMECLHRFCRECIDKSMRLGNNECPACRTHCASRRSLRDDPKYDALISALYPDIDKYEEEELAFHEEEKTRYKQIQASIAQTLRRQSEALGRKRTTAKATAQAFVRKTQGNYRNNHGQRGRGRNGRDPGIAGSDEEDANGNEGGGKDSSSSDEPSPEVRRKRYKRWGTPRYSSGATNADGDENDDIEASRETKGNPEVLSWGKGGARSHTRYGSLSGTNGRHARSSRVAKLVDYLRNLEENDGEFDVHLMLLPLSEQSTPSLQRPYLCCRPTLTVGQLCQFIANQIPAQAEELEILVKDPRCATVSQCGHGLKPSTSTDGSIAKSQFNHSKEDEELRILGAQETLAGLQAYCASNQGNLVLVYRSRSHS